MILDSIRKYIKSCPILKNGLINANYLSEEAETYTIDSIPCAPIIKKYVDGGTVRQFIFILASREYYSANILENLNVSKFYEDFQGWIETQNAKGNLPELKNGLSPLEISVISSGYLAGEGEKTARYQIQCRLIYYMNQED